MFIIIPVYMVACVMQWKPLYCYKSWDTFSLPSWKKFTIAFDSCIVILVCWSAHAKVCQASSLFVKFPGTKCLRQGGVFSPILFTICTDDLLVGLEDCGIGCFWRNHFGGALCYPDNLVLLAPSASAHKLVLRDCVAFAVLGGLKFNSAKTQLICLGRSTCRGLLNVVF